MKQPISGLNHEYFPLQRLPPKPRGLICSRSVRYVLFLENHFHLDVMGTHHITTDIVFNLSKTGYNESTFIAEAVKTAHSREALYLRSRLIS